MNVRGSLSSGIAATAEAARLNGTPRHILLVENRLHGSEALAGLLRGLRVKVTRARHANQILQTVENIRFDLIAIDLHSPDIADLDIVRVLRAHRIDAPFIVFGTQ